MSCIWKRWSTVFWNGNIFWWKVFFCFSLIIISLHFSNICMTALCAIENDTSHSAKRVKLFSSIPQVFDFLTSKVCFQDFSCNQSGLRNYDSVLYCLRHKWQQNGDGICTYNRCLFCLSIIYLSIYWSIWKWEENRCTGSGFSL